MNTIKQKTYTHRSLARVVIEAKTPLVIGSGQKDILTDALIALDVNGLPYIPGTSLAGVIRSMMDPDKQSNIFGHEDKRLSKKDRDLDKIGKGSDIIFSEARIIASDGKTVLDGIVPVDILDKDSLIKEFRKPLPIRQHVRMGDHGTARDGGKFDQQIIYAGTRFCFEIEMLSDGDKQNDFLDVLRNIQLQSFRIGGGVHNGFGQIEVVSLQKAKLDLTDSEQLKQYLCKSSSLAEEWSYWENLGKESNAGDSYITYTLRLKAEDFLLFGSGFGDAAGNADMTSVKASRVDWSSGVGVLKTGLLLIPGTSIKGALRHRVAYYYNRLMHRFVDGHSNNLPQEADKNDAVRAIFGYQDGNELMAGRILVSDIIDNSQGQPKYVNHVSIDRFTGGAIDGALFTEQVDYARGTDFCLTIQIDKKAFEADALNPTVDPAKIEEAFDKAIEDLCKGMLPLGGGVNRGNGIFTGTYTKS